MSGDEGHVLPSVFVSSSRRKMAQLVDDIREIREQGKRAISDPSQVSLFKGMHISLATSYERFESIYDELCDMLDDNNKPLTLESDHEMRARARRYFHESNGIWNTLNEASSRSSIAQSSASNWGANRSKTKLPTLELPRFSGDRTKWPRFKDTFNSLVVDDSDLADIDRFHYLIRSLQGNAAAVIAHVPVTGAHFKVAWDALVQAYDNQRLLAAAYLDQILELKPFNQRPSAETLGQILATLSEISSAFNLLDIPDKADFMFFHLARRCLDSKTREDFELNNKALYPSFDSLIQYLRSRCTASELATGLSQLTLAQDISPGRPSQSRPVRRWVGPRVALVGNAQPVTSFSRPSFGSQPVTAFSSPSIKSKCYICGEQHYITSCLKFATATVNDRMRMLRTWRGCRNCLHNGHGTSRCPSTYRCRFCRGRHHSLLHPSASTGDEHPSNAATTGSASQPPTSTSQSSQNTQPVPASHFTSLNSIQLGQLEVMLGTAICLIDDVTGGKHEIRLVIDSGSHFSFISRAFAERLGLPIETHSAGIWGIGETPLPGFKGRASCTLSPISSEHPRLFTNAIVLDIITSPLPGFSTPSKFWEPYSSYHLADPEFWVTRPIDFLIGCDLFSDIVTGEILTISPSNPRLFGTIFGYSVLGRIKDISAASQISALFTSPDLPADSLDNELRRFWELEEPPITNISDPEDKRCEDWFKKTTYRLPNGRYVVRLPFRTPEPHLPFSRGAAVRRLSHLESKLERNSIIRAKYLEFMSDYQTLGHMEVAAKPGKYFIPHHCVVKGDGDNIKLRVVFDAAAKTASGSLNDFLSVGPKLQSNSVLILLNFRMHAIVFTADAVKMYRQILVHPDDRVYQHILWRSNPSDAITEFELNTVSYGQSCAPYLALRVLQQLTLDEGHAFPMAAEALRNDTYVDDIATGAATLNEAMQLLRELIELMGKGGFMLSKWASNHPTILASCQHLDPTGELNSGDGVSLGSNLDPNNSVKILGMQWNPTEDCFFYQIMIPRDSFTKRAVLSAIAKIYDPLGYLGPTVVLAKKLIQEAWRRRLAWDEQFPIDLKGRWLSFLNDLPVLGQIKISRWIVPSQGPYSILIFADASEEAYCASAYLRSQTSNGPQMHLILAKTKLAPVKFTTIPRLELCAALLAAKLWQSLDPFIKRLPHLPDISFFSDSTVVLTWLRTPYHLLKTFVANRVVQIRDLTTAGKWRHVASGDNPSDLGSRGVSAPDLQRSSLWFYGPAWALDDPLEWPVSPINYQPNTPELKSVSTHQTLVAVNIDTPVMIEWIKSFSSYSRMVRSLAYILRFIDRVKGSPPEPSLTISLSEIRRSTLTAVKLVQKHSFFNNRDAAADSIPKNLINLNAFINESGILMVGGRLKHSALPWGAKHPIILPAKTHLSTLILEHYHRALLHPGPTLLLAAVRAKFWILGVRNTVRGLTKSCVQCRKFDARPVQPIMGDLPSARFSEGRAFLHVGMDFAGPFTVRESLRRKSPTSKAYLCLMVCMSTKALHLELVSSLSTPAFLAALNRFVGRRGLPSKVYSDNGTNFVGAANHLREFYQWYLRESTQSEIRSYAIQKEIEWEFIPPHAPSFGGIWEAGVKAVKRLMRTIYGDNVLTFEELVTLLIKIEAILNSRPLCPLSNDPNDVEYLSPGHFLIGSPLLSVPEPSLLDLKENRLSRWQLVAQKAQHFWKRWRHEYLSTLQERTKWRLPSPNLQVGELVLLCDEGVPRMNWPVGRVQTVYPGKDGVVRVADVRTLRTVLKRPVNKLVPLLFHSSTVNSNPHT